MPTTLSYPGVYIEEVPSGLRAITGVATLITAFVGRALRGPTDEAVTITSYADFERTFGGLWLESSLGYAVVRQGEQTEPSPEDAEAMGRVTSVMQVDRYVYLGEPLLRSPR